MKLSKRLTALFAAVLMTVTMFTSAIPAYASDSGYPKNFTQSGYTLTIDLSSSKYLINARTKSKVTATRIAATIVTTTLTSSGQLHTPIISTNKVTEGSKDSGLAAVSCIKYEGCHFSKATILYSALFNKTEVSKTVNKSF